MLWFALILRGKNPSNYLFICLLFSNQAIKDCRLKRFYTPGQCYMIRQSRYGNKNVSSTNTAVNDARLLNIAVDLSAKREVELQLQVGNRVPK